MDIDDNFWEAMHQGLHKLLDIGGGSQESHRHCYILELTLAWDSKGSVGLSPWVEQQLSEFGSKIYGGENGASRSANVTYAFTYILHGVFICVDAHI